jgi:1-acyl-sn-glycerol-3-phosphate acyltransferase
VKGLPRRLLTVPLYFGLALAGLATAPLWIPALALVDAFRRPPRAALRCGLFLCLYLLCECAGIVASFGVWIASGVWAGAGRRRFLDWNYALQNLWAWSLWNGSMRVWDTRVEVEGADTVAPPPILLLIRHASVADTLIPAALITRRRGIRMRYVLKRELLWDPCLDIVGNRLPNYFVDRQAVDGEREIRGVANLVQGLGPDEGILIYPEGTRFTPAKRRRILKRLAEQGDPALLERAKQLEQTLPPRLGGTLALLEANPGADVVFCAHTGFEGAGSFWDLWCGALVGARVSVRFWRVPWSQVPESREQRISWLYDQWTQIDRWIGERRFESEHA